MNIYTGDGVAAGEINNDGLADLFFSGGQVARAGLRRHNRIFGDKECNLGANNFFLKNRI